MQMPAEPQESEINLGDIFRALYKKIWVLLLCLVAGALAGLLVTQVIYRYTPVYYAEVNMMLSGGKEETGEGTEEGDIVINETTVTPALLRTTIYYLNADRFRDSVEEGLGTSLASALVSGGTYDAVLLETRSRADEIPAAGDITAGEGKIVIYYIFDTNTSSFRACITGANEKEVELTARELTEAIPQAVQFNFEGSTEYSDIELVQVNNIVASLENPNEALTTNLRNVAIGAAFALLIGIIVVVAIALLDNRIKDAEDIPGLAGVSVLGVIPKLPEELTPSMRKDEKNMVHTEV